MKSIQIDLKWLFGDGIWSILNWFKHTEDKMVKTESPSSEEELYIRVWYIKWYFGNGGIANMTGRFFAKLFLRVWYMSSSWINEHIDGTNSTSYMCECEFVFYLDILHQWFRLLILVSFLSNITLVFSLDPIEQLHKIWPLVLSWRGNHEKRFQFRGFTKFERITLVI